MKFNGFGDRKVSNPSEIDSYLAETQVIQGIEPFLVFVFKSTVEFLKLWLLPSRI